MTRPVPVAFYAPLKSPDHPNPSGDRTVARLLWRALERAGFAPRLASRLRTLDLAGDEAVQRGFERRAREEAELFASRIAAAEDPAGRPRLWFTYHAYYKAPDHLGPLVGRRLGIPYVVAEASRAPKRARGAWAFAHRASEAGLDAAALLFASTGRDAAALERSASAGQRVVPLPPFLDAAAWPAPAAPRADGSGPVRLAAVAMMRPGDKLASYALLAEALAALPDRPWRLTIAGDGPARPEVERSFAPFGGRVRFVGALAEDALLGLYRDSDCLVWPAVNEAYGMALLEAQATGCPVLAGHYGGVASVVRDGVSGILTPPGDAGAFGRALADLIDRPDRLAELGRAAAILVRREHGLGRAAARLRASLRPLLV